MKAVFQLIMVMPVVIVFAIVVVALMRQQSQRFRGLEAAYQRRHVHRTRHSPVRSVRIQQEAAEAHDVTTRHAA